VIDATPHTNGRWFHFENLEREVVPACACLAIEPFAVADWQAPTSENQRRAGALCDGHMTFRIRKPSEESVYGHGPGWLAFNSSDAVAAQGHGYCTFDMPVRALNLASENLRIGQTVGPEPDKWHLTKTGCGFFNVGYDPGNPFGRGYRATYVRAIASGPMLAETCELKPQGPRAT
jgi:hypothetical protein